MISAEHPVPGQDMDGTIAEVRRRLNSIGDPCSVANGVPMGVEEMGLVQSVDLDAAGNVIVKLRLTSPTCHMVGYFSVEMTDRLLEIPGIRSVEVVTDHGLDWSPEFMSDDAKRRRKAALQRRGIPVR